MRPGFPDPDRDRDVSLDREWMRGIAPLAVLTLLEKGEMYGYDVVAALKRSSGGGLALGHSTVYPLLYRLANQGHLVTTTRTTVSGRRRKYYRITPTGRAWLTTQRSQWATLVRGLQRLGLSPRSVAPPGHGLTPRA